ncbi:MAG: hypothetical protein ACPL4E_09930 [Thermoproteota archaeon]
MKMRLGRLFLVLLLLLQPVLQPIVMPDVNNPEKSLDELAIVAVHPFNWVERNKQLFWDKIVEQLHVEFMDRATGFMEGHYWYEPNVDSLTVYYTRKKGVITGSYMILTPIPPVSEPTYTDPYGNARARANGEALNSFPQLT